MTDEEDARFLAHYIRFDLDFVDVDDRRVAKWLGLLWSESPAEGQRTCAALYATAMAAYPAERAVEGMAATAAAMAGKSWRAEAPSAAVTAGREWQREAATAWAILRRRLDLEELQRKLASPRNEDELVDVARVDPHVLPEPRRWAPYPNLVHKAEIEELLGSLVSLARARGRFDWVRPAELLEHARAKGCEWTENPFLVPSLHHHGVVLMLLDIGKDPSDATRVRYRVSYHALGLLVGYVIGKARELAEGGR